MEASSYIRSRSKTVKKYIVLLITLILVFSLCSCGASNDKSGTSIDDIPMQDSNEPLVPPEHMEHYDGVPEEMHGLWEAIKVISPSEAYSQDALDGMLRKMKENKTIFELELGDPSYILNPDDDGNYARDGEIRLDFDIGVMSYEESKQRIAPIEYVDGQIYVTDTTNELIIIFDRKS